MSTMGQAFAELKSGEEMRAFLIGKAADDAEFRARLVADPKQVLNEEFGMPLPRRLSCRYMRRTSRMFTWCCRRAISWTQLR